MSVSVCALGIVVAASMQKVGAADRTVDTLDVTQVIVAGTAIADYRPATPAEYAAAADAILDAVSAPTVRRGSIVGAVAVDLLNMFAGGAGAPQDVVKAKPLDSRTVAQ
ncbi:hypothetical protein AAG565_03230 [Fontimonas sp. SYSU GA230001]